MASTDAKFNSEIFRKDHPIILAARRDLASIKPVRLDNISAKYDAGQVLVRDPGDSLFKKYSTASGSGDTTCILFEDVEVEEFVDGETGVTGSAIARAIFGGEVFEDKLTDLDDSAKTELGGKTIVDATGVNIFKF